VQFGIVLLCKEAKQQMMLDTSQEKIKHFSNGDCKLYGKFEFEQPSGSIKDRSVYYMLRHAQEKGLITENTTLIEPSSGNTGISLAHYAREFGYKAEIAVGEETNEWIIAMLREKGALVHVISQSMYPNIRFGTDRARQWVEDQCKKNSNYHSLNQFTNVYNFYAHYEHTGPEIWKRSKKNITHFFAGCGTGGTITGVAKLLKEKDSRIKVIGVQPTDNHNIVGLRNFKCSSMPDLFVTRNGTTLVDDMLYIAEHEVNNIVQLAYKKKILGKSRDSILGPSSAAVLAAMLKYKESTSDGYMVGIFADSGLKYQHIYKALGLIP
jgi:cysteine synthase